MASDTHKDHISLHSKPRVNWINSLHRWTKSHTQARNSDLYLSHQLHTSVPFTNLHMLPTPHLALAFHLTAFLINTCWLSVRKNIPKNDTVFFPHPSFYHVWISSVWSALLNKMNTIRNSWLLCAINKWLVCSVCLWLIGWAREVLEPDAVCAKKNTSWQWMSLIYIKLWCLLYVTALSCSIVAILLQLEAISDCPLSRNAVICRLSYFWVSDTFRLIACK